MSDIEDFIDNTVAVVQSQETVNLKPAERRCTLDLCRPEIYYEMSASPFDNCGQIL